MTWNNPITWLFKQEWSASLFNQQFRDNLNYLKTRPYDIAELGSTNQGSISTTWVKVTNSDLQIVLPVTANLAFKWRLTASHTVNNSAIYIDIWDVDNNVYLSSGTGTPLTFGLNGAQTGLANVRMQHNGEFILEGVSAGTHNYEFRIVAGGATATIQNANVRNTVWVMEVG